MIYPSFIVTKAAKVRFGSKKNNLEIRMVIIKYKVFFMNEVEYCKKERLMNLEVIR